MNYRHILPIFGQFGDFSGQLFDEGLHVVPSEGNVGNEEHGSTHLGARALGGERHVAIGGLVATCPVSVEGAANQGLLRLVAMFNYF